MLTVSLGLVLVLVHLPVHRPLAQVGWGPGTAYDPIPLRALEAPDEVAPEPEDARTMERAPPPTRHDVPSTESRADATSDGVSTDTATTSASSSEAPDVPEPVQIDILAEEERPEVVGGAGSLYLQIRYPQEARRKGIEGQLLLGFTVTKEGDTRNIHVLKSLHPACDSAAVAALRSVRFRPGTQNGTPVPVHMRLPIRFRLLPGMQVSDSSAASSG